MAEVIEANVVLPGTYIDVRSEGLLTVAISTGNVGLIGVAERGSHRIEVLSNFDEGRARFGEIGTWDTTIKPESNLSLVRALKYLTDNGARTIYARRVVDPAAVAATIDLTVPNSNTTLKLRAKTPGAWGNRLQVRIDPVEAQEQISNERVRFIDSNFKVSAQEVAKPKAQSNGNSNGNGNGGGQPSNGNGAEASVGKVTVIKNGLVNTFQLRHTSASSTEPTVLIENSRNLKFGVAPSATDEVYASYAVEPAQLRRVTLRYGNTQEVYVIPSLSYLAQRLTDESNPSKLVEVDTQPTSLGVGLPDATGRFAPFMNGSNGAPSKPHFQEALEAFVEQNIQILIVVGMKFSDIKADILGHVEKTENLGRERIAIVGADSSDVEKILENANDVADKRVVLVASGLRERDASSGRIIDLPPYFAAAAVAGKLASLAPHISLTNKTLAGIEELSFDYSYGNLQSLVMNRVLCLQRKRGIRIVKGISTDDAAFKQISIRRIVDYAKEGTRSGANQYIGRLNNRRVRENLRSTLDGFLADMLSREYLTGYQLSVTADRAMEIRGEVQVIMDLNPTFSIDVIRVIMNLS